MENGKSSGLSRIVLDMISVLVAVIEEKDHSFKGHAERVASLSVQVARKMCLDKKDVDTIYPAALLHDIGLVYIPSEIIYRSNNLPESERVLYEKHPLIAEKILSHVGIFSSILPIIRHHHENIDGSGYPSGLKGISIPLEAKIIRVADEFDYLTAPAPGRQVLTIGEALSHLKSNRDTLFDGKVVDVFSGVIRSTFADSPSEEGDKVTIKQVLDKIIAKFKKGSVQLPVLPTIVQKVKEAIEASYSTADSIAKLLELDAVISIRIISVANSIAFRGREKILTVRQAVPRLGTRETQSIVMAIVNKNLYETNDRQLRALMEQMWRHSLACAFCCRKIAEKLGLGDLEKFFTLGLVHDIGKIPILQAITKLKNEGDSSIRDMDISITMGILKDAHSRFGGALLSGWDFDKEFISVVQFHENPALDEHTEKPLVIIHLANMMTRKIGLSLYNEEGLNLGEIESGRLLALDEEVLNSIAEDVRKTVQESASYF